MDLFSYLIVSEATSVSNTVMKCSCPAIPNPGRFASIDFNFYESLNNQLYIQIIKPDLHYQSFCDHSRNFA
jgi:hypothetical protein